MKQTIPETDDAPDCPRIPGVLLEIAFI